MKNANTAVTNSRIEKVVNRLRVGDLITIHELINQSYSLRTVRAMFRMERTMNLGVLQTAEIFLDTINNLKKDKNENTEK